MFSLTAKRAEPNVTCCHIKSLNGRADSANGSTLMTRSDNGNGNHEFMTTDDVLGYLRVNARTVYRLIKSGELPAVRIGRQWRIRRTDLDLWLSGQRAGK